MPSNVLTTEGTQFEHENSKLLEVNNNVWPLDLISSDLHAQDKGEVMNNFYDSL